MPLSTNVGGCTERHELRLLVCNTKRIKWRLLILPASISLKLRIWKQSLYLYLCPLPTQRHAYTEIPTKMHFHQGSDYTKEFGIGITPNPEASDQTINPETEILNRPSVSPITWLANWTHVLMQLLFPPHTAV